MLKYLFLLYVICVNHILGNRINTITREKNLNNGDGEGEETFFKKILKLDIQLEKLFNINLKISFFKDQIIIRLHNFLIERNVRYPHVTNCAWIVFASPLGRFHTSSRILMLLHLKHRPASMQCCREMCTCVYICVFVYTRACVRACVCVYILLSVIYHVYQSWKCRSKERQGSRTLIAIKYSDRAMM